MVVVGGGNAGFSSFGWKHLWERQGLPGGSVVKNPPASPGDGRDVGLISWIPWRFSPWEDALEMATHSNILWKIPWTEEPSGLQSMGSQRVGHDGANTRASKMGKTR